MEEYGERGNALRGFNKDGVFLDCASEYQLVKNDFLQGVISYEIN